jgi:hypothetical protein
MLTTASFVEGEWISLGKKWADMTPRVKCAATQAFTILSYIHPQIIPSPHVSIHQFLNFSLPKHSAVIQTFPTSEYFSHYEPEPITEMLLEKMHRLSMSTLTVIKELEQVGHQA